MKLTHFSLICELTAAQGNFLRRTRYGLGQVSGKTPALPASPGAALGARATIGAGGEGTPLVESALKRNNI